MGLFPVQWISNLGMIHCMPNGTSKPKYVNRLDDIRHVTFGYILIS